MAPRRTKGKPPKPVPAGSSHAGARPTPMLKAKLVFEITLFFKVFFKFSVGPPALLQRTHRLRFTYLGRIKFRHCSKLATGRALALARASCHVCRGPAWPGFAAGTAK
jgi:hypothetical protein